MELGLAFVVSAGIVAFYTSFNGGANDLANSFGTSVGSGAITLRARYRSAANATPRTATAGSHTVCPSSKSSIEGDSI